MGAAIIMGPDIPQKPGPLLKLIFGAVACISGGHPRWAPRLCCILMRWPGAPERPDNRQGAYRQRGGRASPRSDAAVGIVVGV